MNVLIIGNGGRESAIAREVLKSKKLGQLFMLPFNDFWAGKIQKLNCSLNNFESLEKEIRFHNIGLVIIGPEAPLVDGLSDYLRSKDIAVFGPSQKGAMLEGSKIFCKEFLSKAQIPTAKYKECFSKQELIKTSGEFSAPWIVKADGLAAGKGVYICQNKAELETAGAELFEQKKLGDMRVFIEENLPGKELSYLVITNGSQGESLPIAQDHKRIFDGDKGPNTGGMGVVAPLLISKDLGQKIQSQIVEPFLKQIKKDSIDYRGVVYFGIMVVDNNPFVLEINARFGDPETQVILPLYGGDWLELFELVARGKSLPQLKWKQKFSVAIVLAAPGYPDVPEKNLPIEGDLFFEEKGCYVISCGIKKMENGFVIQGGRVLNVVSVGDTAPVVLENANQFTTKIQWKGLQKRSDIGLKVLNGTRFVF